jgi:hypothetical protein
MAPFAAMARDISTSVIGRKYDIALTAMTILLDL